KFWHRVEARRDGFHLMTGTMSAGDYQALTVGNLTDTNPLRNRMYPEGPVVYQEARPAIWYHWAVNGGNATGWDNKDGANWNSDTLAKIDPKTQAVLRVPVV